MKFTDVLGRFAQLTEEADGGYLALCPAHADSRPSLRIWRGDDNKVRITCRAGCTPDAVRVAARLNWADLFDAEGEGLTVPREPRKPAGSAHVAALAYFVDCTSAALFDYTELGAEEARGYLADRFGIGDDLAAELELGYSPAGTQFRYASRAFSTYRRLTVPLRDFSGHPRGLQGRDLSGKCPGRWVGLMNPEGHRWAPYGVFRGQGGYGVTLVTEGPGDALTAVSVGYDAVAVRGASLAGSPELVAELAAGLKGAQVVVAGDNDTAGQGFTRRLADGLAAHGVQVYTLAIPNAGDDLTDWRARDPDAFPYKLHTAVKAARPVKDASEARAEALSADLDDRTGVVSVDSDQGREALETLKGLAAQYGETADVLNAAALVAWTDGRIKYAPGLGYYVWNGRVWERSEVKVRQEIHRMGAALMLSGSEDGRKASRGFTMRTNIDNLMIELRAVPSVHVDASEFDARPDLLSFKNGTVNLRTGELRPHDKRDMLTYCLDLDFRADAECPRWESFLAEIFPEDPELPAFMRRLVGYGVTGHVSEQCFAVLWGKGANGKSVLTDTLTAVFRNVSKTTPFATFEEKPSGGIPNDVAALRGSRLVMASEGESGKPMSEAVLKRVTGKDMIAARFLRQEFFEFKPSFLLMLATNHKPKFRGQDEGLWRRVKMIPFKRWFAPHERDYGLDVKLLAEAEGIAAWAVRGAVEWFRDGLGDPPVITEASKEYRETSDALAGFFPGVLERDDGAQMSGADAFNKYLEWCEAENLPARERWTRRVFYDAMEERAVTRKKTMHGIALMGVRDASKSPQAAGPGIFTN
ncbi:phage/plasmid primase, P4 family [Kitasatospora cathayae]|uniref:Phage/plasmid primase, P4 family n=1 Tax=Kitasatospora cathayae TaxID=3004092 RepID=A0ABY7Q459_9ACTN|nr:phage/plasmid primase, P4 family [Kitasatospora sp. HUAS 3-15]WBP87021.1 phage/plasmid primase, P4 family [Kitasatospora sp. HUAS 3-15]